MRLTTTEIARAVSGELVGDDIEVVGAAIDSRTIQGGELFVPIVAERDGHDFIAAAIDAGAAGYLTNGPTIDGTTAIRVHDTGAALLDAGRLARTRHASNTNSEVVGITGSVGKTTVKDLTAAALASSKSVHASVRSFNNEMGVPLTLLNAPDDTDVIVVEMGARGKGHIALLCDIAHPTIGIITTVALAHAEMFGTVEDVAAAKSELVEALPDRGTAVLNGDHPLVAAMASRTSARVITFGLDATGLDVTASDVELDDELRPSFHLHSPWGGADVRLPVRGLHQVANALAAAGGAMAAGATPDAVAAGLATATLSPWRMELQRTPSGALVLNDAYNANPTSMEAALRSLAALAADRRVAVVGVMAELGVDGPAEHRRMASLGRELGIEMIAVNAPDYGDAVTVVADIDAALAVLGPLQGGDAVLVKGSRVAGLERLAARLVSALS